MHITYAEGMDGEKNGFSNESLPKNICKCTIYDCEFDSYHEGVMCSNKILVIQDNESLVPAKNYICEYVDYGLVQFFVGELDNEAEVYSQPRKWGYFDYDTGNIVIKPKYDYAGPFYGELALVVKSGKIGFIDPGGNEVISLIWDEVIKGRNRWKTIAGERVEEWDPWVVRKGDKWGYINQKGEIVIPLEFDHAATFVEDRAEVMIGNKYGYINKNGLLVIKAEYEDVDPFKLIQKNTEESCYVARVKKAGKYGYIDKEGHHITDCIFDEAFEFWDLGYAGVKVNDKWSIIDTSGHFVVYDKFDDIGSNYGLLKGFFASRRWGSAKLGYSQHSIGKASNSEVYFTVMVNNQWGIMDIDFNIFMPTMKNRFVEYKGNKIYILNGDVTSVRKIKAKNATPISKELHKDKPS